MRETSEELGSLLVSLISQPFSPLSRLSSPCPNSTGDEELQTSQSLTA